MRVVMRTTHITTSIAATMIGWQSLSSTVFSVTAFGVPRHGGSFVYNTSPIPSPRPQQQQQQQQQRLQMSSSSSSVLAGPSLPPVAATAKRLFLVRHGEVIPPGGVHGVFYGALDVPLSPLGEEEAVAAAEYLAQFELEYVASSPLRRAVYGAEETVKKQRAAAAASSSNNMTIYEGFRELDRGAWCGLKKEEIGVDNMDRFNACDETVTPEGGESMTFVKNRVLRARDELLSNMTPGRLSAVVSHLQVTRCILSEALGIPIEEMTDLRIKTASITCIDFDADSGTQTVHYQSFKPEAGLKESTDGGNDV